MKILGIESASSVASAAVLEDDRVLAELTSNYKKTHSETLLPMIEEALKMSGTDKRDLDLIAVSAGPGSFTGLRIGASIGKGLAFALNKPMAQVPTLKAMAYGCFGNEAILCPLIDARHEEVYAGLFSFEKGKMIVFEEAAVRSLKDQVALAEELASKNGKTLMYLGDGVDGLREKILGFSKQIPWFAAAPDRYERGTSVAALGREMALREETVTALQFEPIYLQKSQAERERLEKGLSIEPLEPF